MLENFGWQITKTDFLIFLDAPKHLWAKKHGLYQEQITELDQHIINDGMRVENLAVDYVKNIVLRNQPSHQLLWQQTYTDGEFSARPDMLIYKPEHHAYDLYEVKSSTAVDRKMIYDVAFQKCVLEASIQLDHTYVLHLNKDYLLGNGLDLAELFTAEDVTQRVLERVPEVRVLRQAALQVSNLPEARFAEACYAPKTCPCPDLCHPNLPDYSIYEIPRLLKARKKVLAGQGINLIKDLPNDFKLNHKQDIVVNCVKSGKEFVDAEALKAEFEQLAFPVWFLDYETCISAIPLFKGHHPQQQIVFQYSLDRLDTPDTELVHFGHIVSTRGDPTRELLEHLAKDLGDEGSVVVWNKAFEASRNRDMALIELDFAKFLMGVNDRIYDLMEIVEKGIYYHPDFRGSSSIKQVLPVMVPELSYDDLAINRGDQASMAWWKFNFETVSEAEHDRMVADLEKYCALDTLAMVEIYRKLRSLVQGSK